jgi:predicted NUDIX family phosphoesterase
MTETIVCLASRHVDAIGLTEGFTRVQSETLDSLFLAEQIWLGPRAHLETDETYRQLVSYVVFRHAHSVLVYRRTPKGGEARLHGRLSVGVGGHVNVTDVTSRDGAIDIMATLRRACAREIAEEVRCSEIARLETVGVIRESVNAVSRVHLGVVVECWLSTPDVDAIDPGLIDLHFAPVTDLALLANQMETWSQSLVTHLSQSAG